MKRIFYSIFLLMLITSYSQSSESCKVYKKLSKDYLKCIAGKLKDKSSEVELDTANIKEKKTISDWFKKKKWVLKKI